MKYWLIWVLAVMLVFAGCQLSQPDNTTLPANTTQTPTAEATLPETGSYLPDCQLTAHTDGAVRGYGIYGTGMTIGFMENDPVILSVLDDTASLQHLQGEEGYIIATHGFKGSWETPGCGFGVGPQKIVFYNEEDNSCVVLDQRLREQDRIKLPEGITSAPWFNGSLSEAYFVMDSEIRALDMQTGIPRLISQMPDKEIRIKGLVQADAVLWCGITEPNGNVYDAFLSAENGMNLETATNLLDLETWDSSFMVRQLDGSVTEVLFGNEAGDLRQYAFGYQKADIHVLPGANAFVAVTATDAGLEMELLSLTDGKRIAALEMPGICELYDLREDPTGQYIWFAGKETGADSGMLFRWDYAASQGADQQIRLQQRVTAENPDTEGLAACESLAQQLGEKYGVQILLQRNVIQPEGYSFTQEYQVPAYEQALTALDHAMALYPEDFFRTTASISNNRTIHISLVRSIENPTYGAPDASRGLQYWIDGSAYFALVLGDSVEESFHRQLSHVMDTYVYSYSIHYDFWKDQNPEGFAYDENYTDYVNHGDSPYLDDENRAFIDAYSMTYDHEDRAAFMAYAMMDGMESWFENETMQAKLNQLCIGIRQAYRWKKYEGTFHWEQYLKTSLAYTGEE